MYIIYIKIVEVKVFDVFDIENILKKDSFNEYRITNWETYAFH